MSKTRSIWESRFYALKNSIEMRKEDIESMAADVVLEDAKYDHDELKIRHDELKRIKKRANDIETRPLRYLWVGAR